MLKHEEEEEEEESIKTVIILTWGGLQGGISIALALRLSKELLGEIIRYTTYVIVLFWIIVQGFHIGKVVKKRHL